MRPLRTPLSTSPKQRGAVLMVMLVIMIMGVSFLLVSALSKVTLQNARNEKSSEILAQTKEVIMGYILAGDTARPPGMMMYPDVRDKPAAQELRPDGSQGSNYDGDWEYGCFDILLSGANPPYTPLTTTPANMRCLGRLPWKKLGMSIPAPSENDPTGFMPWYAFSRNLIASDSVINSELLKNNTHPWLKVYDMNGTLLSDRVAFVIILPGAPLPGQSRPLPPLGPLLGNPDQYLDSISIPPGCSPAGTPCVTTYSNYDLTEKFVTGNEHRWMNDPINPGKQIEDPTYQFNDKLLYVTIDELMPLIEKRISREVKTCLDDYAAVTTNIYHRYPWATIVSDNTAYLDRRSGTYNVRFGRIPEIPNIDTLSGGTPPTGALLSSIQAVQTALTNYLNNPTPGNLSTLRSRGDTLKDLAKDPPYNQSLTDPARAAGITADNCNGNTSCTDLLTTQLTTAMGGGTTDNTMPSSWLTVPSCNQLIFNASHWQYWRDLVFYQVADGYQPGGGTWTPLHISGSGNPVADIDTYRAAVIVAGSILTGQTTRPTTNNPPSNYYANNYLEAGNNHQSQAGITPNVNFITYKPTDTTNYSTVNDLVLCVDGGNYCK